MKATHQVVITADISRPVEEIAEIISLFLGMVPAEKQEELLQAVDQLVGDALAGLVSDKDTDK
ncbi:hypothetical protein HP548_08370 [Paenibacillus taichungensis]|uniref:Uncharacterized protein n=1 Tax=Paenibacillus taichungensis TaxID=484184 RepID=A0ABX2MGQ0_9BACL|nr:hypothetical protein [Paenibacillus taichungensis]NUU54096.1 hypothetical protein [Paenibacillus taichungensis]